MPTADVLIPAALPSDSSDVADALDVARALLEKGQTEDAIRWVRKAVEAADHEGDAGRVATLARTVADLAGSRASVAPTPAVVATLPSASVVPVAATPSVPPAPVTPRAPSVAPSIPPAPVTPRTPSVAPNIPPAPVTPRSPSVAPRALKPSTIPQAPPTPRELPATRSVPPKPAPPAVPTTSARAGRVRVSVRTSVRDPNLLVVRPLADGAPLPRGTRLAFLEMADEPVVTEKAEVEELHDDAIAEVESSR